MRFRIIRHDWHKVIYSSCNQYVLNVIVGIYDHKFAALAGQGLRGRHKVTNSDRGYKGNARQIHNHPLLLPANVAIGIAMTSAPAMSILPTRQTLAIGPAPSEIVICIDFSLLEKRSRFA